MALSIIEGEDGVGSKEFGRPHFALRALMGEIIPLKHTKRQKLCEENL